jgi:AcrR family transcriptional regulator
MGLRERKIERTRELIVKTAVSLFETRGFDATTMREIAQASEIGPATLYRYFSSKEAILLEPATRRAGRLAAILDARPGGEPIDLALGGALRAFVSEIEPVADEIARVRRLVDAAPAARARVWDTRAVELDALTEVIARRADAAPDELWVVAAARTTMMITETALDLRRDDPGGASMSQRVEELIATMTGDRRVLPRLQG